MTENLEVSSRSPKDGRATTVKSWIILGIAAVLIIFVVEDLLGWINGGGIFSLFAADHAINAKAPFIDVDGNALRAPFIAVLCPVVIGACLLFRADMNKGWQSATIVLVLIGSGFALDEIYGHRIIAHFMATNGYERCPVRDHEAGNGKSRVWFDDYVRMPSACHPVWIRTGPRSAATR